MAKKHTDKVKLLSLREGVIILPGGVRLEYNHMIEVDADTAKAIVALDPTRIKVVG